VNFLFIIGCNLVFLLSVDDRDTVARNSGFLACHTKRSESLRVLEFLRDLLHLQGSLGVNHWLNVSLQLSHARSIVALFQDDQIGLVGGQTSHVDFQRFVGLVGSAVIDSNTDCSGVFGADSSTLELFQGEPSAQSSLGRVFLGGAMDNGAQLLKRSRGRSSCLLGTSQTTSLLLRSLVQVQFDLERSTRRTAVLLVEMKIGDDIVMLDHFDAGGVTS
jgi:hypothetical protein